MFKNRLQDSKNIISSQEVAAIKTPHEKLIEFLESRGLNKQADSLRNGATQLDISCNKIGDSGAKLIAEALKDNNSLTQLHISWSKIGDAGAKLIAEALKDNNSLTYLELEDNNIGDILSKKIKEKINYNILFQKFTSLLYNYFFENNSNTYDLKVLNVNKKIFHKPRN